MADVRKRYLVITTAHGHSFLYDLFVRATNAGLIAPDELTLAGGVWDAVKHPQVVDTPDTPRPLPPVEGTEGSAQAE